MQHSRLQFTFRVVRRSRLLTSGFIVACLIMLASAGYAITGPHYLTESVDDVLVAGKSYQFWYTTFCIVPGLGSETCTCVVGGSENDCIATQDSDSNGLLDTGPDEDGDGILDVVDPDFTTNWGSTFAVESVPYNLQQTIDVYVNTFGLRQPYWVVDFNRDVYIFDSEFPGATSSFGEAIELDTDHMLERAPSPRTTIVHELWHTVQYAYRATIGANEWFTEGQARLMPDKVFADLDTQAGSRFTLSTAFYLADPNYPEELDYNDDKVPETIVYGGLLGAGYDAALFWNYLTEQAGTDYVGTTSEGVDFIEDVLLEAEDPFIAGQFATELAIIANIGRTFDNMWWDFTIANYAKDFDLDQLDPAQLDSRDPTLVLDYRDETGTPYGTVMSTTLTVNEMLSTQIGSKQPQTFSLVETDGIVIVAADGDVPPYGVHYYKGILPNPNSCPVAFWEVEGDPNAALLHSSMLIQDDTDGNWVEEVVDLQRHNGDSIEVSYLNRAGASHIVGIVATLDEVEGYIWEMGCSSPFVDIVLPIESDMAAVGAPDAPGNFELWVEVTSSINDDPISGLDATRDFTVTVGGDVAQILSGDYVQNQYWLVVQAPAKPGANVGDSFEVRVELVENGAADQESSAVLYDAMPTDTVLVVDRSGSMALEGKLTSAKAAARIKADVTNQADQLGVASFSNDASEDFTLTLVPDQDDAANVRANAKTAVDSLVDANQTSIGDGLAQARDMLINDGNPDNRWIIVLLSDGEENEPLFWSSVKDSIISTVDEVHAITLGSDADPDLMREIAALTCGDIHVDECFWALSDDAARVSAAAPGDLTNPLADIYLRIGEGAAGRQRIWQEEGTGSANIQFEVARDDMKDAIFGFNWKDPASPLNVTITPPVGQGVTFIPRSDGANHIVFYAEDLPTGTYTMNLGSATAEWIGSVSAVVPESESLRPVFDNTDAERVLGEPARLRVSLVDKDGPVIDATVSATVYRADVDPTEESITLNDAGVDGDNRPGDGIYSYDYDKINALEEHNYTFDIVATGAGFARHKRVTYRPADTSIPDANNDGLFDNWQQKYGVQGGNEDDDRDGLNNHAEMNQGTDPTRADTDRGGEIDGSEVSTGRNPLDASDDAIPRLTNFWVENANESVILRFNPRQEFDRVRVFQSTQAGPWTSLGEFPMPTGSYSLTNLINDQEYLYFVQPLAQGNIQGAFSSIQIAEPAADTVGPKSEMQINHGAPETNSISVTVSLLDADAAEMKVSNGPNLRGVPWQPFATELSWTIAPNPQTGLAAVYALLRDANGNVSPYAASDGILYNPGLVVQPGTESGIDDSNLESGAWYVADYPPIGPSVQDLSEARRSALGLQTVLSAVVVSGAGMSDLDGMVMTAPWTPVFTFGNSRARAAHWRGSEELFVDMVDLVYFVGQARPRGLGFVKPQGGLDLLMPEDVTGAYGDGDADWIGLAGSGTLAPLRSAEWAATMNGLRLLMGFETSMADEPHGAPFAAYLRNGYSLTQAWFKALDRHQPPGVTARILAEQPSYYNDTQKNHNSKTEVDAVYCSMSHSTGKARPLPDNVERPDKLPVFGQDVLTEAEAEAWFAQLGTIFGVDTSNPLFDEATQAIFSADGQLEMDRATGAFQYVDTTDLWLWKNDVPAGARLLTQEQARQIADEFLAKHGLLPEAMQFDQVAMDTMTCAGKAQGMQSPVNSAAVSLQVRNLPFTSAEITEYQVQYWRPYAVPIQGGKVLELPVVGPGAKVKTFVNARSTSANADDLIVGVVGGRADSQMQASGQLQAIHEVTPLTYAIAEALALHPELATLLSFAPASPDNVQERQVEAYGFAYWQRAIGSATTRLIPIYRMLIRAQLEAGGSETYHIYLPASAIYMPPLARIQSMDTKNSKSDDNIQDDSGVTFILQALDAQTPLNQAGYGANLNVVLGSNQANAYLYNWYFGQVSASTLIGRGRTIEYTVPADANEVTIILEVVDSASPRGPSRSYAAAEIVVDGDEIIYLPQIKP